MDDLISRAAAIAEVEQWAEHGYDLIHWTEIKAMLEVQPAVDAAPVVRVMTREEYRAWGKLPDEKRVPVVIENRMTNSLVWCWWAAVAPDHDMTAYRVWTAWPTEEQREAAKWD